MRGLKIVNEKFQKNIRLFVITFSPNKSSIAICPNKGLLREKRTPNKLFFALISMLPTVVGWLKIKKGLSNAIVSE
jgi:hypothetical protein